MPISGKSPVPASKEITRLEKEMLKAAKNLEFERAAALRDELKKLRESVLILPL